MKKLAMMICMGLMACGSSDEPSAAVNCDGVWVCSEPSAAGVKCWCEEDATD